MEDDLTKLSRQLDVSMVKILGYENGEIDRLYLLATTGVVILSIALSLVISNLVLKAI